MVSTVTVPAAFPPTVPKGSPFSMSPPALVVCWFIDGGHSHRCPDTVPMARGNGVGVSKGGGATMGTSVSVSTIKLKKGCISSEDLMYNMMNLVGKIVLYNLKNLLEE